MRKVEPALPYPDPRYANPPRTWQLAMIGDLSDTIAPLVAADLGRLLDLRPDIGRISFETIDGGIVASRDWPSDRMEEADALIARIEATVGGCELTLHPRAEMQR